MLEPGEEMELTNEWRAQRPPLATPDAPKLSEEVRGRSSAWKPQAAWPPTICMPRQVALGW